MMPSDRRWSDADPADGTWGGVDVAAVKLLIVHQRRDIGSCLCGWGVDAGNLGQSHALHVWRELQRTVLPDHDARVREQVAEEIADDIDATIFAGAAMPTDLRPPSGGRPPVSAYAQWAAAIARAHRSTPTEEPTDA